VTVLGLAENKQLLKHLTDGQVKRRTAQSAIKIAQMRRLLRKDAEDGTKVV
jgi:hypothetical protein